MIEKKKLFGSLFLLISFLQKKMAVINSVRMCFITQARREGLISRLLDQ